MTTKNLFKERLLARLSRKHGDLGTRRHDFRDWIGPGLDQAVAAGHDVRKRGGGRAFKHGDELRVKSFATRCRDSSELMEFGHIVVPELAGPCDGRIVIIAICFPPAAESRSTATRLVHVRRISASNNAEVELSSG